MKGAVCPSCGVAVSPGYARCPKCRKPLPRRLSTQVEGGTALEGTRRFPVIAIAGVAVVGIVIIVWLGMRGGGKVTAKTEPAAEQTDEPTAETPDVEQPANVPDRPETAASNEQSASEVATELERALRREKLWSTVSVTGARVDVRSSSCGDAKLSQLVDGAASSFKTAGVTKLRCLEQSGVVVSTRDL